ncbi:hypothetical protein B9Z65_1831 [Elsinoe australis]|uniref:Uncharacterized protein n=1 Tax=Elsinoe australis TaxID=40998 RepID=A0A2P7YKZ1_9PEZI|nr:hypothetical protein B9Z65_1831 [Elsinoe australis]
MGIKKRAANGGPASIKPKKSAALGLIQPKTITAQPFDQLEAAAQKSHITTMNDLRQFYNAALFAQEQAGLKLAQENKDHQATKKHLNKRVEEGKKAAKKVVMQNEELRIKNAQLRKENEAVKMGVVEAERERAKLQKQWDVTAEAVNQALVMQQGPFDYQAPVVGSVEI